ncbi:MAG: hypothetical protein K6G58_04385 [Lachnospiraceae bacterium]|nr:hypothetical protein [Lachnospiraceae bacterium]
MGNCKIRMAALVLMGVLSAAVIHTYPASAAEPEATDTFGLEAINSAEPEAVETYDMFSSDPFRLAFGEGTAVHGLSSSLSQEADGCSYSGYGDACFTVDDENACYMGGFYISRNKITVTGPDGAVSGTYYADAEGVVTIPESSMRQMAERGGTFTATASADPSGYASTGYVRFDTAGGKISTPVFDGEDVRECGKGGGYYFIDKGKDSLVFSAEPVNASNTEIIGFTCRVYKRAYGNGASGFSPSDTIYKGTFSAAMRGDGKYEAVLSGDGTVHAGDFDGYALYVEIIPTIRQTAYIRIGFRGGESGLTGYRGMYDGSTECFDIRVGVGAASYPVVYEDGSSVSSVPKGSEVTVKVTPRDDCLQSVSRAVIFDAASGTKGRQADGGSEFTLNPGDADEAKIDIYTVPAPRLEFSETDGEGAEVPLAASGGKYALAHDRMFAARACYSVPEDGVLKKKTAADAVFYDGRQKITKNVSDGILSGTPDDLGFAGRTVTLIAKSEAGECRAVLVCSSMPQKAELAGFAVDRTDPALRTAALPFDTDRSYKAAFTQGADLSKIRAYILDGAGLQTDREVDDAEKGFAVFDRAESAVNVSASMMIASGYRPGDTVSFAFFEDGRDVPVGGVRYSLLFEDILSGKKPKVTADENATTAHEIGLNLALPAGVKATEHMYFGIVANANKNLNYEGSPFYSAETRILVPADRTSASVPVTDESVSENIKLSGIGWKVDYSVYVWVGYYNGSSPNAPIGITSEASEVLETHTKAATFETKAALVRKAPAKIFTGQNDVYAAQMQYSSGTTIRRIAEVRLIGPDGRVADRWDAGSGTGTQKYLRVDNSTGRIWLDTYITPEGYDEDDDSSPQPHALHAGKYMICVYPTYGSGIRTQAQVQINVVNSIAKMSVTPESCRIYKQDKKKAVLKAEVTYYDADGGTDVDTKRATWSVTDADGGEITPDSPLYGKVTVKAGTVTVDPKLYAGPDDPKAYTFRLKVRADDYRNSDGSPNPVYALSGRIQISREPRIPSSILLAYPRVVDLGNGDSYTVREPVVSAGKSYSSDAFDGADLYVKDQRGSFMDASSVDVRISGLVQDGNGKIHAKGPGKAVITASARDGSGKSCRLEFTVTNLGAAKEDRFVINTLIQASSFEDGDDEAFYASFLNAGFTRDGDEWIPSPDGKKTVDNPNSFGRPFYVYVAGCRQRTEYDAGKGRNVTVTDYGRDALIDHSLSNVKGGMITAAEYGILGSYCRYTIVPSAPKTTFKVTDRSKGRKASERYAEYTVVSPKISDVRAPKITADRKTMISSIWDVRTDELYEGNNLIYRRFYNLYGDDADNPNTVTFTIDSHAAIRPSAGKSLVVILYADPDKKGDRCTDRLGQYLLTGKEGQQQAGGCLYAADDKGRFTVRFFRRIKEKRIVKEPGDDSGSERDVEIIAFDGVDPGSYTLYAAVGEATVEKDAEGNVTGFGDDLVALSQPCRLTLKFNKAPAPSARLASSKLKAGSDGTVKAELRGLTNCSGISEYSLAGGNMNGTVSMFGRIFKIAESDGPEQSGPKICINDGLTDLGSVRIGSGKNPAVINIRSWDELGLLMKGKLEPDGKPAGTAAQQKSAYKKWKEGNCRGFIGYSAFCLDGSVSDVNYAAVTIDIDEFLEQHLKQPCAE